MPIVNELLNNLTDFVNRLQEENLFLKRGYDEVKRENERLKDNEKEMLKVSSIITTSNENTKLKNYINILEEQLQKYKSNSKVVFEACDQEHEVEEEQISTVETEEVEEQISTVEEVEDKSSNNIVEVVENKSSNNIVEEVEDKSSNNIVEVVEDKSSNNIVEEVEDKSSTDEVEVNKSKANTDNPNIIDNYMDSLNTDEIDTDLRVFKYKNETYYIDENNVLYENNDNVKGKEVGKRRLNKKTQKFKTILYEV